MTTPKTPLALLLAAGLLVTGCSSGEDGTRGTADGTGGAGGIDGAGGVAAAQAEGHPAGSPRGITVTGQGEVRGQPEILRATLGVEVTEEAVQAAIDTANERASEVVTALEEAGVSPEDIQTQQLSLHREHPRPPEPGSPPSPEERPFVAAHRIDVDIRDVDGAGQVLQGAIDAGGDAARVHGIRFDVDGDRTLLEEARQRAFADARDKAEQYAQLAGRGLGELISLREQRSPGPPPPAPVAEDAAAGGVPIAPGTQQLTVHVTAVWSLD